LLVRQQVVRRRCEFILLLAVATRVPPRMTYRHQEQRCLQFSCAIGYSSTRHMVDLSVNLEPARLRLATSLVLLHHQLLISNLLCHCGLLLLLLGFVAKPWNVISIHTRHPMDLKVICFLHLLRYHLLDLVVEQCVERCWLLG